MLLWLAPMDGFTDCAFRQITKEVFEQYGEKDTYELYLWTEFMNADGYMINPLWVIKHLLTSPTQAPVIAQIFGGNEEMLVSCFRDIQQKYSTIFAGIELNMGCPARNVIHTGGWSALLKDKTHALDIIKQLRSCTQLPLSIKTRIGLTTQDYEAQMDFVLKASTYVDMITIHGRTVQQWYTWAAERQFVETLKRRCTSACKIIGNGSISSYAQLRDITLRTPLDGIMIGQAAIGNPRIFTPHIPSRQELKETILRHLDYMISYEYYFQQQKMIYKDTLDMPTHVHTTATHPQAITLAEFRKHLFQYIKGIPWSKEFKVKVSTITDYDTLVQEIQKFLS